MKTMTVSKDDVEIKKVEIPGILFNLLFPFFVIVFPFLPVVGRIRLGYDNGRTVTIRPVWRIAYATYRKIRMSFYKKARRNKTDEK